MVQKLNVRGPSYPDEVIRQARELKLDGKKPKDIVHTLAVEYPELKPGINTVNSWTKGLKPLGLGRPWDFVGATPQERALVGPLFAGFDKSMSTAVDQWPAQDVANWVVRIRLLRPRWWFADVHRRALLLAHYDRAIADGTGTPDDEYSRRSGIAELMSEAGEDQYGEEAALQNEILRELEEAPRTPSRTP